MDDKRRTGDNSVFHKINASPLSQFGYKLVTGVCMPLMVAGVIALVKEAHDVSSGLDQLSAQVSSISRKNEEQDQRLTRLELPFFNPRREAQP